MKTKGVNKDGVKVKSPVIFVLFILSCLSHYASAQEYAGVKDVETFMRQYKSVSQEIKTLEADFTQEKEIALLTNKLHSSGRMIFRNDNRLKIEYFKPNAFIFAMQGEKITIKDGERAASSISTKSSRLFEQISQITMHAINGRIFDSKGFSSNILEDGDSYLIVLVPKSGGIREYYRELNLHIAKKTFLMEKMTMKETSGDKTVMNFKNIRTNNAVSDEVFVVD
ncbi:MAG: outer membrane lipoprotein carrier protein LolA [Prevotellaceae bacterium]|jgi:outer membrane lipoprotein-sorting protein|nr:outer membrane lipoprotein carrier protein LolA [Prevotellaceae bacterium]